MKNYNRRNRLLTSDRVTFAAIALLFLSSSFFLDRYIENQFFKKLVVVFTHRHFVFFMLNVLILLVFKLSYRKPTEPPDLHGHTDSNLSFRKSTASAGGCSYGGGDTVLMEFETDFDEKSSFVDDTNPVKRSASMDLIPVCIKETPVIESACKRNRVTDFVSVNVKESPVTVPLDSFQTKSEYRFGLSPAKRRSDSESVTETIRVKDETIVRDLDSVTHTIHVNVPDPRHTVGTITKEEKYSRSQSLASIKQYPDPVTEAKPNSKVRTVVKDDKYRRTHSARSESDIGRLNWMAVVAERDVSQSKRCTAMDDLSNEEFRVTIERFIERKKKTLVMENVALSERHLN